MPSNVENILNAILTGDGSGIQKPASRVEELLFEIYEQGGGGGGDSVIGGIKLTIDENYVMTATLVDKDGEEYGVSDDIDLPLEEMVVDAEYDPLTQKIKLELKNGNYVEFSVAELVSGLQTELSSDNKLNPAYIAYDASHRAVSDTEKNTWNAKQNAISDLEAIRSGASAGATAVQPATMETALNAKQDTISDLLAIRSGASAGATAVQPATMTEALAAKQNSLSETQLAAVNSGINSTKVGQIETNKTNILYNLNMGVKNLIRFVPGTFTNNVATFEITNDGKVIINSTSSGSSAITNNYITLPAGKYRQIGISASGQGDVRLMNGSTRITDNPFTLSAETTLSVVIFSYATNSNVVITPMLCTEEAYAQSTAYQPPALPNSDLTRLEAEDRASLAEVVDSGAKNLLDLSPTDTSSITKSEAITITRDSANEFTITRAASPTAVQEVKIPIPTSFPTNKYVILSGCPSNGAYATYSVEVWENNAYLSDAGGDYGSGTKEFKFSTTTGRFIRIRFGDNTSFSNLKFKFMCCTKAAFDVSQKFVPYRPNWDLVSNYVTTPRTKLVYIRVNQYATTQSYTMKMSDFANSQLDENSSQCGTYLISVVTWATSPKHGLWIVSYSGGARSYAVVTNIVGADAATVSVVTNVSDPYIEVTASGKVTISTLN